MRKAFLGLMLGLVIFATGPVAGADAQAPTLHRCGTGIHAGEAKGMVWFPEGDLFCPVLADPKAEHSFVSYMRGEFSTLAESEETADIGAVGLADRFVLVRWGGHSRVMAYT